jgi:outer membrane lipase/esterase
MDTHWRAICSFLLFSLQEVFRSSPAEERFFRRSIIMNLSISHRIHAISVALLIPFIPSTFAASYDQMIVFGDSLSDNGNFSLALGPGVLSALNYDSMRLTDGLATTPATSITGVTVEQLNQLLGLPTLAPALLGGNNYAWARATTASNAPDPSAGVTPGTGTQIAAYLSTHPQASPDSLYVLWAGANDLFNASTPGEIQSAETAAISNLNMQVSALLSAGAKNILWFNIPDLSLTPAGALEGAILSQQLHASSLQFKQDWANSIDAFRAAHPDASIAGVDSFAFLFSLVTQSALYGLTNVTTPAQGQAGINPDQYLFWDTLHPTTNADTALARFAAQQLPIAAVPEANSSIYLGVLLLGLVLRKMRRSHRSE